MKEMDWGRFKEYLTSTLHCQGYLAFFCLFSCKKCYCKTWKKDNKSKEVGNIIIKLNTGFKAKVSSLANNCKKIRTYFHPVQRSHKQQCNQWFLHWAWLAGPSQLLKYSWWFQRTSGLMVGQEYPGESVPLMDRTLDRRQQGWRPNLYILLNIHKITKFRVWKRLVFTRPIKGPVIH